MTSFARAAAALILSVLSVPLPAWASGSAPPAVPSAEASPLPEATAIRFDGHVSEEFWRQVPAVTGFVQREPDEGKPASFDTEVRVAFDGTHLYVAVKAFDAAPGSIVGLLTRRDTESPSDWVHVYIDSYLDRRTAYEFAVNAAGVKLDRYWFNDASHDTGWDAVWDVAVSKGDGGWEAEFRIPFSQLRFRPSGSGRFGFAVGRAVARLNETSTWPLLSRSASGFVSSFGELRGLAFTSGARRLELMPYAVSQLATRPTEPGNPLLETRDPGGALGLDLKYAVTPALTMTATLNPDFGQVEADPAVVNLSAFETFFQERRPFFMEGSGVFSFDIDCNDGACSGLFYSRRIGRAPQVDVAVADDGFSSSPSQTTILGASKLTGRIGHFSIGALNAITSEESARVAAPDGSRLASQAVEPLTSYTVIRARREFANQSSLGIMTTATNRSMPDGMTTLANQAYAGGVDADWRLAKRFRLAGFWAGSTVRGDAAAIAALQESNRHLFQRPDADHVEYDSSRTSLNGHAGKVEFSKIAGERVRFSNNISFKSPGFEINDLGYMRRGDQINVSNWWQLRRDRPSKRLRSVRFNFNHWRGWNFDGDLISAGININAHWEFANSWRTGGGVNVNGRTFDDRRTRGGPGAWVNPQQSMWHYVESDERPAVSVSTFSMLYRDTAGSWEVMLEPSLRVRVSSAASVSAGVRFDRNVDDAQWIESVTDAGDHHVFGHLDQKTVGLTFRANYTLGPTLSLQMYAEPFVSSGHYTGFKELQNGRAAAYDDRYAPYGYGGNPDFRYTSFRTTNVLRWEYRPGSALFVVWQQGREGSDDRGRFDLGRDFGHIFSAPSSNVFLVKLSYWLNL